MSQVVTIEQQYNALIEISHNTYFRPEDLVLKVLLDEEYIEVKQETVSVHQGQSTYPDGFIRKWCEITDKGKEFMRFYQQHYLMR